VDTSDPKDGKFLGRIEAREKRGNYSKNPMNTRPLPKEVLILSGRNSVKLAVATDNSLFPVQKDLFAPCTSARL